MTVVLGRWLAGAITRLRSLFNPLAGWTLPPVGSPETLVSQGGVGELAPGDRACARQICACRGLAPWPRGTVRFAMRGASTMRLSEPQKS